MLGKNRSRAFWRVVALVVFVTVGWVISLVAFAAGLLFMLVDIILQFLFNSDGFSKGSTSGMWLVRLYEWQVSIIGYIVLGSPREFPWTP